MTPSRPAIASIRAAWTLALATTIALGFAASANAALYKWIDANGRVVYSDQPPPGNIKSEQLTTTAAPPSNPNAVKDMANKDLEFKKQQLDRAEAQQKSRDEREELVRKNEACVQVRSRITQLGFNNAQILTPNDKGEMVVMDDAARAREKQQLELFLRQNKCPSA